MPVDRTEESAPSPEQLVSGTGRPYPIQDHSWTVQQLHELTGDVGGLKEAVSTLKESLTEQNKTLSWVKYAMFIAIGAGAVIGYFFDKRFDQIMEALATK